MQMKLRATISLRLCSMSAELPPEATVLFAYQHPQIPICMRALARPILANRLHLSHAVSVVAPLLWIALPSTNPFAKKASPRPGLFSGQRISECIQKVGLEAIQSQGAARCHETTELVARPSDQPHLEVLLLRQDGLGTGANEFESYGRRCVLQSRPPVLCRNAVQLCEPRTHQGSPDPRLGVEVAPHQYLLLAQREAAEVTPAARRLGTQKLLDVSP